jgi:hypothetical protein
LPQNSKRSAKSGKPRRRRRRPRARPKKSDNVSKLSNEVQKTLKISLSTDSTCERLLGLLRLWVDHSCLLSATRQPLAANPSLSIHSRVRRWKEWHSTLQTISCTGTPITMGLVIRSRRTGRTTRCTNNVVNPSSKRSRIYSWLSASSPPPGCTRL